MYPTLLKIKNVAKKVALSELSQVNAIIKDAQETSFYLEGVRSEYSVNKSIVGRPVGVFELTNQYRFVDKIVSACHLQSDKLVKLEGVRQNKINEIVIKNSEISIVTEKYEAYMLNNRKQRAYKEDAMNVELFNIARNFKKLNYR
jgi:hypothetical protein